MQRVTTLGQPTKGIGDPIEAFRRVAEQTYLLTRSAAVEAAPAGNSDRGFSVVAGQVRQLAAKSKANTEVIGLSCLVALRKIERIRWRSSAAFGLFAGSNCKSVFEIIRRG